MAISPDGKFLAHAGETLTLWDLEKGRLLREFSAVAGTGAAITFANDGRHLLVAAWDEIIFLDIASGINVTELPLLREEAYACGWLEMSPDRKYASVPMCVGEGTILLLRILDVERREWIKDIGIGTPFAEIKFSPDGSFLIAEITSFESGRQKTQRFWRVGSFEELNVREDVSSWIRTLVGKDNGADFWYSLVNGQIIGWDLDTKVFPKTVFSPLLYPSTRFGMAVMSPDGEALVTLADSAFGEDSIMVWETRDIMNADKPRAAFSINAPEDICGMRFAANNDENVIVTCSKEKIYYWKHGNDLVAIDLPSKQWALSPDGSLVFSDGRVIEIKTGELKTTLEGLEPLPVSSLSAASDGLRLLVEHGLLSDPFYSTDSRTNISPRYAKIWDFNSGSPIQVPISGQIVFSPDGRFLVDAQDDGTVSLVNAHNGETQWTLSIEGQPLFVTTNNRNLISFRDNAIFVHDFATGGLLRRIELEPGSNDGKFQAALPRQFALSNDELKLAILHCRDYADRQCSIRLWDLDSGQLEREFSKSFRVYVSHLEFLPGDRRLLEVSCDDEMYCSNVTVKIWDVHTGQLLKEFSGIGDTVSNVALLPDGDQAVTAVGGLILLIDLETGAVLRKFPRHQGTITSLAISPDGKRVFSGHSTGVTRIWNFATAEPIADLFGFDEDWLTIIPEGFFDGSPEARKHVSLVRGLKVISTDRSHPVFYRPDLVREKLAGDTD